MQSLRREPLLRRRPLHLPAPLRVRVLTGPMEAALNPEVLRVLVDNHARFLAFLERRVESHDAAEDILQEAFVRGIGRGASLRDHESVTAWFYRLLRNALVDHYRRRDVERRAMAQVAAESSEAAPPLDTEMMGTVCQCVGSLLDTLKPEYAAAIRKVDLEGMAVRAFAEDAGITANNAGVRLHRAHEALRRQLIRCCGTCATHGCVDCRCGGPARTQDARAG